MASREFSKNNIEKIRVTPKMYGGYELVDVRIFTRLTTGEIVPTKKGISINVEKIPELIEALTWALGQECAEDPDATPEKQLDQPAMERLANVTWEILRAHKSHVHWDLVERMVRSRMDGFSKWDLHRVLASRGDLFEWVQDACYRARRKSGG